MFPLRRQRRGAAARRGRCAAGATVSQPVFCVDREELASLAGTIRSRPPPENLPMDAIDRKILHELQQDASLSVAEIGNRVGLSSTPCWKPIQNLEAAGLIENRVALLDQAMVG